MLYLFLQLLLGCLCPSCCFSPCHQGMPQRISWCNKPPHVDGGGGGWPPSDWGWGGSTIAKGKEGNKDHTFLGGGGGTTNSLGSVRF